MISTKVIYFAMNMVVYSTHTFSFKFFQDQLDLDVWWVGAIGAVSSVHLLGALLWGRLADRFPSSRRLLLTISTVLYGITFSMLNVPIRFEKVWARVVWGAGWHAASIVSVAALFPLVDAHVLSVIGDERRFGRERVWGTAGHAVATLITGLTIDRFGYVGMFANLLFSGVFFISSVMFGISTGTVGANTDANIKMKSEPNADTEPSTGESRVSDLLTTPFMFLMIVILSCGVMRSTLSIYLPLYMQNEMGRSAGLVAAVTAVRTASEAVVFMTSPWFFAHLRGAVGLLLLAQLSAILRCLSYAALPVHGSWFYFSFAIELLKGVSTAAVVSGGVVMAQQLAPKRAKNTAQACFSGVYNGVSGTVGGVVGGVLLYGLRGSGDKAMRWMFFIMASAATVSLVIFIVVYMLTKRARE